MVTLPFVRCLLDLPIKRCRTLIQGGKRVYLLLDSGTTIFPFFGVIGKQTVKAFINHEEWIKNLYLETNNLPGVDVIMQVGRVDQSSRYSPLAIECNLLPGTPLPVYSALTGKRTVEALERLHEDMDENTVFIALVTGNWIRLRRTNPPCPLPLARGEGHLEFKQALINFADEVYVTAPLGKIFFNVAPEEVNKALGLSELEQDLDMQPYKEVIISNEKAKCVKLVSTSRSPEHLLKQHSASICAVMGCNVIANSHLDSFLTIPIEDMLILFSPLMIYPMIWINK